MATYCAHGDRNLKKKMTSNFYNFYDRNSFGFFKGQTLFALFSAGLDRILLDSVSCHVKMHSD